MERVKNIIVLLLEILLILAVILFIAIFIGTNSTEKTYKGVLADIKAGNFEKAEQQIKTIPHYKDSNDISIYIYPISLFYDKYDTKDNEIKGYRMSLKAIHDIMPKLTNVTYKKDLTELSKVLTFKISEIQAEKTNVSQDKLLSDIAASLKIGDVAGASDKLEKLGRSSVQYIKTELLAYISFINAENLDNTKAITESIKLLDPNYTGIMSDIIQTAVLKYVDSIKWSELYKVKDRVKTESLTVGMSRDVLTGMLKTPLKSNVISNKYGHFEIIYDGNGKTLYMENNKLKAYAENDQTE